MVNKPSQTLVPTQKVQPSSVSCLTLPAFDNNRIHPEPSCCRKGIRKGSFCLLLVQSIQVYLRSTLSHCPNNLSKLEAWVHRSQWCSAFQGFQTYRIGC